VQAGLLAVGIIIVLSYLGFTKDIPFTRPYELKAVFANAQNIGLNSPVRIAGVEVGKVSKVESAGNGSNATVVTMKILHKGLPVHKDAELKIRPRIFLEGNFFVDMNPGRPSSPEVKDGGTIPMTQTASPVQLDQVLTTLQSDSRDDLRKLLAGYGGALSGTPAQGEDADQDPDVQGETGAQALNKSLVYSPEALRGTAVVNDALQGTQQHDLSKLLAAGRKVTAALGSHEEQLKDLITNFNTTTGALASEQSNLRATVRVLPRVLEAANPALDNLNRAFPPTRAFAREILPGVRETPATIAAALPWIAQTQQLASPAELQGLVADLKPATRDLAEFTNGTVTFLPQADLVNRCALHNLLPTGDEVIQDPPFTSGVPAYKEFFQVLTGLSGESANFDGNGQYTRVQPGSGKVFTATDSRIPSQSPQGLGPLLANAPFKSLGTRPAKPHREPPYNRKKACYRNAKPDLSSAKTGPGP
jgi:ABC-type transporter Mla subunit MlaD